MKEIDFTDLDKRKNCMMEQMEIKFLSYIIMNNIC